MANSADPDQKPTDRDLPCLQRQDVSGLKRNKLLPYCVAFGVGSFSVGRGCLPCTQNSGLSTRSIQFPLEKRTLSE